MGGATRGGTAGLNPRREIKVQGADREASEGKADI